MSLFVVLQRNLHNSHSNLCQFSATRKAIAKYSDAVEAARLIVDSRDPLVDALNNRAAAQLRLGNYGRALADSCEATQLVPTNIKAHYRYVPTITMVLISATSTFLSIVKADGSDQRYYFPLILNVFSGLPLPPQKLKSLTSRRSI